MNDRLTGKYCFSTDLFGDLILWVEVDYKTEDDSYMHWRKARAYDLRKLNLTFE